MNIKNILTGTVACAIVLGACTSPAFAASKKAAMPADPAEKADMYVALRGGLDMMRHHGTKNTWIGAAAIGGQYWDVRAELEYTYHGEVKKVRDGVDTKTRAQSYMMNLYYDIPTGTIVTPFVQAGAGISHIKLKEDSSKSKNKFSWGVGGGVGIDITKNWAFDVGYRYVDVGESVTSNEFYAGVRYAF